jgi:hypothetical protein
VTALALGAGLLAGAGAAAADPGADAALLRAGLQAACPQQPSAGRLAGLPGAAGAGEARPLELRGRAVGQTWTVPLADGGELRIERIAPGDRLRRVALDLRRAGPARPRPTLFALADGGCTIRRARRLTWDDTGDESGDGPGRRDELLRLGADLTTVQGRQPLNPPVPPPADGAPPAGPRVALVDSGVAYTLPLVARRLAREPDGRLVGYDFWEDDRRPFDGNPARSPYFPQRHGTETASVILREAPSATLVPYRYPRPDMARMADLVRHAAAAGVVIVAMPLGSRSESDWTAFAEAARAHPDLLFLVAAGNTGRSLAELPVWPPVLDLDNMLVVTSATADGRLARGSTWSRTQVDLMLPAESVPVTDWQGRGRTAAGTSYAAPRLAALAARLLARHPDWRAPELKRAILARAEPPPAGQAPVTRHGWIADPVADPRPAAGPADGAGDAR